MRTITKGSIYQEHFLYFNKKSNGVILLIQPNKKVSN